MKVTDNAIKQFKNAIEQYDLPGSGIRLFKGSGCCGPAIQISVVNHPSAGDKVVTINDIDFFVESHADQMLTEVTIDFRDENFKLDGLKKFGGCCG